MNRVNTVSAIGGFGPLGNRAGEKGKFKIENAVMKWGGDPKTHVHNSTANLRNTTIESAAHYYEVRARFRGPVSQAESSGEPDAYCRVNGCHPIASGGDRLPIKFVT